MNKDLNNSSLALINRIKSYENDFTQLIRRRLGIVIHTHQSNELFKTILDACRTFNCNADDYLHRLTIASDDSPLLEHLIAGVTVGETYFFRDKHQMQLLTDTLLPQLIQSKRAQHDLSLRIWSAGCATGEEIYTLGMMLLEQLPDFAAWRIQLLATDLNTRSLQKAMTGQYTEWSMRAISPYFKDHYFTHENNHYMLAEKIRDVVRFNYLNLNDDTYPALYNGTNAQDLILCRNVLIYFDNDRISRLMKKLNLCLIPGGYLILGASDPIMTEETDLIFHHQLGIIFSRPTLESPPVLPPPPAEAKIKKLINMPVFIKTAPQPTTHVQPKQSTVIVQNQQTIMQLLSESRWQDALETIQVCELAGKKDSTLLSLKATAYANLGQLEQSLQSCLESLKLDATNKYTYLTLALTLIELNRQEEAEEALRKTLFLDRQFVVGHFQLGLLLLRKKQYDMGMKSLTNALTISEAKNASESVPGYQGLNYGKLSEIFRHEITMYAASGGISHATQNVQK